MTNRTLTDWIDSQEDRARVFAQEKLIVAATEELWARMDDKGVNKVQLAAALDRSKAYVSQVLNGTRNMTLRTLADFAYALDCTVKVHFCARHTDRGWMALDDSSLGQRRPPQTATVVSIFDARRKPVLPAPESEAA